MAAQGKRRPVWVLIPPQTLRQVGILSQKQQQLLRNPQGKEASSPEKECSSPEKECSSSDSTPDPSSVSNDTPPSSPVPGKVYVSHSDVEKKRKQKISNCIQQLSAILGLQSQVGKLTRADILQLALDKIKELKDLNANLEAEHNTEGCHDGDASNQLYGKLQELIVEHVLLKQQIGDWIIARALESDCNEEPSQHQAQDPDDHTTRSGDHTTRSGDQTAGSGDPVTGTGSQEEQCSTETELGVQVSSDQCMVEGDHADCQTRLTSIVSTSSSTPPITSTDVTCNLAPRTSPSPHPATATFHQSSLDNAPQLVTPTSHQPWSISSLLSGIDTLDGMATPITSTPTTAWVQSSTSHVIKTIRKTQRGPAPQRERDHTSSHDHTPLSHGSHVLQTSVSQSDTINTSQLPSSRTAQSETTQEVCSTNIAPQVSSTNIAPQVSSTNIAPQVSSINIAPQVSTTAASTPQAPSSGMAVISQPLTTAAAPQINSMSRPLDITTTETNIPQRTRMHQTVSTTSSPSQAGPEGDFPSTHLIVQPWVGPGRACHHEHSVCGMRQQEQSRGVARPRGGAQCERLHWTATTSHPHTPYARTRAQHSVQPHSSSWYQQSHFLPHPFHHNSQQESFSCPYPIPSTDSQYPMYHSVTTQGRSYHHSVAPQGRSYHHSLAPQGRSYHHSAVPQGRSYPAFSNQPLPYIQDDHVMSCDSMTTPPYPMLPHQVPSHHNTVWRPYSEPNRSTGFYLSDILAEPGPSEHPALQLVPTPPPTTTRMSFFVDRLLDDIG